jgi:uncharacterized membrane protein YqiK
MMEAPKVISRVGSMQNLVDHVLQPIVGNYFRNAAQTYTVLDFLIARSERQAEAAQHIAKALRAYDVEAIDTLIGDINPPETLMQTLTDRKIAEEQRKTYQVQQAAQEQRQLLVRETAQADIQQEMVAAERSVNIAELHAQAEVQRATGEAQAVRLIAQGEAESIRAKGEAQAEAYRAGAQAMGVEGYTSVQLMQVVGQNHIRILPEIMVGGSEGKGSIAEALLGVLLQQQLKMQQPAQTNGHNPAQAPVVLEPPSIQAS